MGRPQGLKPEVCWKAKFGSDHREEGPNPWGTLKEKQYKLAKNEKPS